MFTESSRVKSIQSTCIDTVTSLLDSFSDLPNTTPVLLSDQSVFESESYAVSPSGSVNSSPVSDSPEPPASISITVSPANLSAPLLAVSPSSHVGSSPTSNSHVSPGGISITVAPGSSSAPISAGSPPGVDGLSFRWLACVISQT